MHNHLNLLQEKISWNGISFYLPVDWEIESLDYSHMVIANEGVPKMEIKWTDSPKKFTLEKYLKKFISTSQRSLNIKISEASPPDGFIHPNAFYNFFFFSWHSDSNKGVGALIFCNHCKRLTLMQFFTNLGLKPNSPGLSILYSFVDHSPAKHMDWQIFGLAFSSPDYFKLVDYSFKPGFYQLDFKYKRFELHFYSWGPAAFLLKKMDLSEFAINRVACLKGYATAGENSIGTFLEWEFKSNRFGFLNISTLFNIFDCYTLFRIYNDTLHNRLLGIYICSPERYEREIIKESVICV